MKTLETKFYELYREVREELSNKEPFDLRDNIKDENGECDLDSLYDLPFAYTTDKHGYYYIPLAIVGKDKDNNLICVATGEEYPNVYNIPIGEAPVESLFELNELTI